MPHFPITTPRLYLRPFGDNDLDDLFAFHSRPEVAQYLYWFERNLEDTKNALEHKKNATIFKEDASIVWAVVHKDTSKLIGEVSLTWHSQIHQQGEVGFVFNPDYQRKGYATESTLAVLSLGFNELKLHRIYGRCDTRNIASYKLMERLGMRREAHFIHNEIFKGEWGDEFVYALLAEEWRAQKN
jgi:RimJ/RimL family protein N-acetyltransferase